MDQIVNQLSEIEATAQKLMEDTATEKKQMSHDMDEKMKEYDVQVDAETAASLLQLQDSLKQTQQENLQKLREYTKKQIEDMDTKYQAQHTKMAQQLLDSLIGE